MSAWKKLAAAPAASTGAKQPTHLYLFTRTKSFCIDITDPNNLSIDTETTDFYAATQAVHNQLTNTTYLASDYQTPFSALNRRIYSFTGKNFVSPSTYDEDASWPSTNTFNANSRNLVDWVNGVYFHFTGAYIFAFTLSGAAIGSASLNITTTGNDLQTLQTYGLGIDPNNQVFYAAMGGTNAVRKYDYSGIINNTSPYIDELYTVFQDDPGALMLDIGNSVVWVQETDDNTLNTIVDSGTALSQQDVSSVALSNFKDRQNVFIGAQHDPDTLELTSGGIIMFHNQTNDMYKYTYDTGAATGEFTQIAYKDTGHAQTYEVYYEPWTDIFYIYYNKGGARYFGAWDPNGTNVVMSLLDEITLTGAGDAYGITPTY